MRYDTGVAACLLACVTSGCASTARERAAHAEPPAQAAPPPASSDGLIGPEAARADLEFLYRSLRSAHYDLYAYRSAAEYDEQFRRISARLAGPMSRLELVRELQPFVAYGRVGHARIEFPIAEYVRAAQEGGTVLPFDVRVDGDRVLVTHSYLDGSRIRPGVELIALDERPVQEIVADVSRYVSGERAYMVHAQLERFFPRWLWVARGSIGRLTVSARSADGDAFVETVAGLPIGQVEPLKSAWTETLATREVRLLDERTAYLRPGPFYNVDAGDPMDVDAFRQFVDEAFRKIRSARSQRLIVDVRDNPGGDNSFSDLLVAWFASRPFRFSDRFSIKVSPEIRRQYHERSGASSDENDIIAQMYRAMKGKRDGEVFRFELPKVPPRRERFEGRVFLLVNRHSYSNAASLAGMLQDYRFAKIVGEETADLPTSYASSAQFSLPGSGLVVTYPKGYFVRPSGDETLRGVIPDISIAPAVFVEGHEAVLRAALHAIDDDRE